MLNWTRLIAIALFTLLAVTPVAAQQPGPHPDGQAAPAMPGGGMGMGMDMCRQMMGEAMTMPADPKQRAAMMEMRGEMMKTMGDLMMKHARRMQEMTGK